MAFLELAERYPDASIEALQETRRSHDGKETVPHLTGIRRWTSDKAQADLACRMAFTVDSV